jgi:hypothetical protein
LAEADNHLQAALGNVFGNKINIEAHSSAQYSSVHLHQEDACYRLKIDEFSAAATTSRCRNAVGHRQGCHVSIVHGAARPNPQANRLLSALRAARCSFALVCAGGRTRINRFHVPLSWVQRLAYSPTLLGLQWIGRWGCTGHLLHAESRMERDVDFSYWSFRFSMLANVERVTGLPLSEGLTWPFPSRLMKQIGKLIDEVAV